MNDIELTPQFRAGLKALADGQTHLFITGKAGTGKSTLLRHYSQQLERRPIVLAPTGIAALNVGGQTIHRFFKFRPDIDLKKIARTSLPSYQARLYRTLKEIIIDEISMVRADLLDCVDAFLRRYGPLPNWPFGGVRLVMFGDLYQIPPVVKNTDRELIYHRYGVPYFFAAHALRGEQLQVLELDRIFRQTDAQFIELLNSIRINKISAAQFTLLNSRAHRTTVVAEDEESTKPRPRTIIITTTNARAKHINSEYLARIEAPQYRADAIIEGEFRASDQPTDAELYFKCGAVIIMLNNDSQRRWVNGSMATIVEVDERDDDLEIYARIDESGEEVLIERHRWSNFRYTLDDSEYSVDEVGGFIQFPFRLAWAITVHKSQGKTFARVHLDLGGRAFAAGQTYVALSRCRTLNDLSLRRPVTRDDIYVDQSLVNFFAHFDSAGGAGGGGESDAILPTTTATIPALTSQRKSAAEITELLEQSISAESAMRIEYIHRNGHIGYRTVRANRISEKTYRDRPYIALEAHCIESERRCIFNIANIINANPLTPPPHSI